MASSVSVQIQQSASDNNQASILGWIDVTAAFEGSIQPFDCAAVIGTITSFLGSFAGVPEVQAAAMIRYLGEVSTTCTDGEAVLSSGLGI